jgi:hypothetical protein
VKKKRISIRNKGDGKVFFPTSEVVRVFPGDRVTINYGMKHIELEAMGKGMKPRFISETLQDGAAEAEELTSKEAIMTRSMSQIRRHENDHGLKFWLGAAGGTGLVLGGPLSAILAYLSANILIREETRMHGKRYPRITPFSFKFLFYWLIIGSLAMPASWWITRTLGWNLDVLAVIESQGKYKSYKDWSEAENAFKRGEQEKQEATEARNRLRENQIREENRRKRAEEDQEKAENEANARKAEQERMQAEQQARESRVQKELDKWNDPVRRQEREAAHRQHLLSVGCVDENGNVIRTLFCLNTEAPPP